MELDEPSSHNLVLDYVGMTLMVDLSILVFHGLK
jgi:hypothetical protein